MECEDAEEKERTKVTSNSALQILDQWPLKLHSKPDRVWQKIVEKKFNAVAKYLSNNFSLCARTDAMEVSIVSSLNITDQDRVCHHDLNKLMAALNVRFNEVKTHAEKVQVLTLKPASWTLETTMAYFGCTQYAVTQTNALRKTKGVIATPQGPKALVMSNHLSLLSSKMTSILDQGSPNYGPWARGGPRSHFIRPAKPFC